MERNEAMVLVKRKSVRALTAVCGMMCLGAMSAAAAGLPWTWALDAANTGSTVTNMSEWAVSANWGVESGYPSTAQDVAIVKTGAASYRFIHLPDGLQVGAISADSGHHSFVGTELTILSTGFTDYTYGGPGRIRSNGDSTRVYADILAPDGNSGTFSACGDYTVKGTLVLSVGSIYHRANLYANSSDPVRHPVSIAAITQGSGSLICESARKAAAQTRAFNQVEGSPYLFRADDADAYTLAVGAPVSGAGIPSGTFLKRIFNETCVELSNPVTTTTEGNNVEFAAFGAAVYDQIDYYHYNTGNPGNTIATTKHAADEILEVDIADFTSASAGAERLFRIYTADSSYPGTLVLHNTGSWQCPITWDVAQTLLAGDTTTDYFPKAKFFTTTGAGASARFMVTNDLAITLMAWTNLTGTVRKQGTGTLVTGLFGGVPASGTFSVDGGTLVLSNRVAEATIGALTAAAGTTLRLVAGQTLHVSRALELAAGSTLDLGADACLSLAPGLSIPEGVTVTGEGHIERTYAPAVNYAPIFASPAAKVVGNPAFWVDAASLVGSSPAGVVEDAGDKIYVSRWNDCRGDAAAGYHFATNVSARPWVENVATKPYVWIPQSSSYENDYGLVWDTPIENIRAVFAVLDAKQGCYLLGSTYRLPRTWFLCGSSTGAQLFYQGLSPDFVKAAPTYFDGILRSSTVNPKNEYGRMVLIENHPTEDGAMADAFGVQYSSSAGGVRWDLSGNQRIHEVIVYTNELTYAERVQVADYLMRKWEGKSVPCQYMDARQMDAGVTLADDCHEAVKVDGEHVAGLDFVQGAGTFEKTGSGTLVLFGCGDAQTELKVSGGTLMVNSEKLQPTSGAYLHLDANAADTLTTTTYSDGSTRVTEWTDCDTGARSASLRNASSTNAPRLKAVADLNGLNVLDFGPAVATNGWDGMRCAHNPTLSFPGSRSLQTIFTVIGSAGGGNTILGGTSGRNDAASSSRYLGIWRNVQYNFGADAIARPIIDKPEVGNMDALRNLTSTEVRKNGVTVDQTTEPLSGAYDLVSVRTTSVMESNLIGGIHYGQSWGGVEFGEIIYYTDYLSQFDFNRTEAYLQHKWFGRTMSNCCAGRVASIELTAGATLQVVGGEPLTTASLGGAGTVNGKVVLTANAKVVAKVTADGAAIGQMALSEALDLSLGGTVTLDGDANKVAPGDYVLVSSASGTTGAWSLDDSFSACSRRVFSLTVQPGKIVLHVMKRGSLLIVR